jgi:Neutral/alkaline non-lysosomal ceramidase, C-terminal
VFGTPLLAEDQPLGNQTLEVMAGQEFTVLFQGANPRNNFRIGSTFFTVYRQLSGNNHGWEPVLYDSDFDTWFVWKRSAPESHTSTVRFHWQVPSVAGVAGLYRVVYTGDSKNEAGVVSEFHGEVEVRVRAPAAATSHHRRASSPQHSVHPSSAMLSELDRWYRAQHIDINERS